MGWPLKLGLWRCAFYLSIAIKSAEGAEDVATEKTHQRSGLECLIRRALRGASRLCHDQFTIFLTVICSVFIGHTVT